VDKGALRSGVLAFVITLLFFAFVMGAFAVVFRSAEVLYGEGKAFSVKAEGDAVMFTVLSEEKTLSRSETEHTLSEAFTFSPFLPLPLRSLYLSAGFFSLGADRLLPE